MRHSKIIFILLEICVLMPYLIMCKKCCPDGEIFLVEKMECTRPEKTHEKREANLWRPIENVDNATVLCNDTATSYSTDQTSSIHILLGDVRHQLMNVTDVNYCTQGTFTEKNQCHSQVISLVGNNTVVLSTTSRKDECGPTFRYCQGEAEKNATKKIPKCCGPEFSYDSILECVRTEHFWPAFAEDEIFISPDLKLIDGKMFEIITDANQEYYIDFKTSDLQSMNQGRVPGPYCMDRKLENGSYTTVILRLKAAMLPKSFDLTFLSFETIFMGTTFLIHLVLPQFKNLPGTIMLLYTGTYLVWDFLRIHLTVTEVLTPLTCFLNLVTLPYLNWSKCWWLFFFTFELLLRIQKIRLSSPEQERKRLILYCLIAWVFTGIFVIAVCITQGAIFNDFRILTENEGCNFLNRDRNPVTTAFVMITPCTISGVVDMILLVVVTKIIRRTSLALPAEGRPLKHLRKRYQLLIRLYTLGVTKLMYSAVEISAIYLDGAELARHVTLCVVQLIYAFVIFVIFSCNSTVKRQIATLGKTGFNAVTSYSSVRSSGLNGRKESAPNDKKTKVDRNVKISLTDKTDME